MADHKRGNGSSRVRQVGQRTTLWVIQRLLLIQPSVVARSAACRPECSCWRCILARRTSRMVLTLHGHRLTPPPAPVVCSHTPGSNTTLPHWRQLLHIHTTLPFQLYGVKIINQSRVDSLPHDKLICLC